MERKGIISAGNWVFDNVKILDTLPEPGMLGSIIDEDFDGGGAPFNVLVDLSKIDNEIPLYGAGLIGNDFKGEFIRKKLNQNNINDEFIETTSEAPTSYTDVMTEKETGARTFFHCRGANALLDYPHFERLNTNAKIFHLGYLLLLDKLDAEDKEFGVVSARVLKLLKEKGYKTSVDVVSESGDRFKKLVTPTLKYIDYLIINELEAERITGFKIREDKIINGDNLKKAAQNLLDNGVNELVVIHFPEGGLAKSKNEEIFTPSWLVKPNEIVGSNGAGDAFCAGMLYSIHENFPLEKALKVANAAARFNLQSATSTGGAVSFEEIEEYIETAELRNDGIM